MIDKTPNPGRAPNPDRAPTTDRAKRGILPAFTPVPRHYQRFDGWTPDRQHKFIEAPILS